MRVIYEREADISVFGGFFYKIALALYYEEKDMHARSFFEAETRHKTN